MNIVFNLKQHLFRNILIALLPFIFLSPAVYLYIQNQQLKKDLSLTNLEKTDVNTLLKKVSELMKLPEGEIPTVATVTDRDKLAAQPFFNLSENGDKVIIYTNAKRAILYRPSINKIIDVAPVNVSPGETSTQSATPETTSQKYKIFLLNGTTVVGLTRKYEEELKTKGVNFEIVQRDNARKKDYEKTLLVDVSGTKKDEAKKLAETLGINISNLPENESATTSADFVIIVGNDKK